MRRNYEVICVSRPEHPLSDLSSICKLKVLNCIGICILVFILDLADVGAEPITKFNHIWTENGLPSNGVWRTIQDQNGFIWVGTKKGVVRYNGYEFDYPLRSSGDLTLSNASIRDIVEDDVGNVWLATESQGLLAFRKSNGLITQYMPESENNYSISSNNVCSLSYSEGQLWVGSSLGLDKLDIETGVFTHYSSNTAYRLPRKMIWSLYS